MEDIRMYCKRGACDVLGKISVNQYGYGQCCWHCFKKTDCEKEGLLCREDDTKKCGSFITEDDIEKIIQKDEKSSVEIRLFNHKNNKVLYENLTIKQLEHILKVLNLDNWN